MSIAQKGSRGKHQFLGQSRGNRHGLGQSRGSRHGLGQHIHLMWGSRWGSTEGVKNDG